MSTDLRPAGRFLLGFFFQNSSTRSAAFLGGCQNQGGVVYVWDSLRIDFVNPAVLLWAVALPLHKVTHMPLYRVQTRRQTLKTGIFVGNILTSGK